MERAEAMLRVLSAHNAALVLADHGQGPPRLVLTADFAYGTLKYGLGNPAIRAAVGAGADCETLAVAASEGVTWLQGAAGESPTVAQQAPSLISELQKVRNQSRKLSRAARRRMCAGVFGPSVSRSTGSPPSRCAMMSFRSETVTPLFNGKDLRGLTTWLKDAHHDDPRHVFSVDDGMLHLSGAGDGSNRA